MIWKSCHWCSWSWCFYSSTPTNSLVWHCYIPKARRKKWADCFSLFSQYRIIFIVNKLRALTHQTIQNNKLNKKSVTTKYGFYWFTNDVVHAICYTFNVCFYALHELIGPNGTLTKLGGGERGVRLAPFTRETYRSYYLLS